MWHHSSANNITASTIKAQKATATAAWTTRSDKKKREKTCATLNVNAFVIRICSALKHSRGKSERGWVKINLRFSQSVLMLLWMELMCSISKDPSHFGGLNASKEWNCQHIYQIISGNFLQAQRRHMTYTMLLASMLVRILCVSISCCVFNASVTALFRWFILI